VKLAFGCGEKRSPGEWVYLDAFPYEGVNIVHRWAPDNPVPLADGSVDEVLLALDVIEHCSRRDADFMVQEWSRLCAPGAALIVCTIDIERTARWLLELPGEALWVVEHIYGRQNFLANRHFWAYTKQTLQDLLQRWGFVVERFADSELHRGNFLAYCKRGPDGWKEFDEVARAQV
jgi:predicted SAM-dependent methyltransferase